MPKSVNPATVLRSAWRRGAIALLAALVPHAAFAAVPTHTSSPPGAGGPTDARVPGLENGVVAVCDQMAMVTAGTYTTGNGNAMAGAGIFSQTLDLQMVDDCVHAAELEIIQVCQASITFVGQPPANGLWVQVYADTGGAPANAASFDQVITSVTSTPFVDSVLGFAGLVICADLAPGFVIPAGTWWWDIQPVSLRAGGDWYYQLRRTSIPPTGGDSFLKDGATEHGSAFGGPFPGGYGITTWQPVTALGYAAGDAAFLVRGQPVSLAADLAISKSDGLEVAEPGDLLTYTLVVSNFGPGDAPGTNVTDTFSPNLSGVSWTCSASAGSSCTAGGVGNIVDVAHILAGGTVTYLASAVIDPGFSGALDNTAAVTAGPNVDDPDPANGTSTDTTLVRELSAPTIPTLDEIGLGALVVALAGAAVLVLRRR